MEETFRRYPIGIQDFEQLRNNNYIYVDKTALVYQLANTNTVYFLSRPRRFGERAFQRTCHGAVGTGLDGVSGAAHRLQRQ